MRRAGNLIGQIASYENMALAFTRAARGKWNKSEVQLFSQHADQEIALITKCVLKGELPPGKYRFFEIHDPKSRIISVAPFRHRVLHHAIMNICGSYFDRPAYFHSYACRSGKGSLAAVQYVKSRMSDRGWYLKMDVRKYFDSIDHDILLRQCSRIIKDKVVLTLMDSIIRSHEAHPGKGLPIGNLSSQYLANHYLSELDRFIKEELRARYMVRYMDDILIFNESRETLKRYRDEIVGHAQQVLGLNFKVAQINSNSRGIPFLGYRVFRDRIKLGPNSKRRLWKKWRAYDYLMNGGLISQSRYAEGMRALLSFAGHADIAGLKKNYIFVNGFISE